LQAVKRCDVARSVEFFRIEGAALVRSVIRDGYIEEHDQAARTLNTKGAHEKSENRTAARDQCR
jgi:hypothetical protein